MRHLFLIMGLIALSSARPEKYREKEDFQYSKSSTDEGTKSGYYKAQKGNVGDNYEKAHNMDILAQNQMSGALKQIDGEFNGFTNQFLFGSMSMKDLHDQGDLDLSNLSGRNFAEGVRYYSASGEPILSSQNALDKHTALTLSQPSNDQYTSDGFKNLKAENIDSKNTLQGVEDEFANTRVNQSFNKNTLNKFNSQTESVDEVQSERNSHQMSISGVNFVALNNNENSGQRVVRSRNSNYNMKKQSEEQSSDTHWEDIGQQTQGIWENLEDIGQQQEDLSQHSQDLGQQNQNLWTNGADFGQETQSGWEKQDTIAQQTQNLWDNDKNVEQSGISEDFSNHPRHILSPTPEMEQNNKNGSETFSLIHHSNWEKYKNRDQQNENMWHNIQILTNNNERNQSISSEDTTTQKYPLNTEIQNGNVVQNFQITNDTDIVKPVWEKTDEVSSEKPKMFPNNYFNLNDQKIYNQHKFEHTEQNIHSHDYNIHSNTSSSGLQLQSLWNKINYLDQRINQRHNNSLNFSDVNNGNDKINRHKTDTSESNNNKQFNSDGIIAVSDKVEKHIGRGDIGSEETVTPSTDNVITVIDSNFQYKPLKTPAEIDFLSLTREHNRNDSNTDNVYVNVKNYTENSNKDLIQVDNKHENITRFSNLNNNNDKDKIQKNEDKFSISQGNEFNSQFMKNETHKRGYNNNANFYGTNQDQTDQQFESFDQQFEDFGQQFEDIGQQFESTNQQKRGHNNTQEELMEDFGQQIQTSWYPSETFSHKHKDNRNKEQSMQNGDQSNTFYDHKVIPNEKDQKFKDYGQQSENFSQSNGRDNIQKNEDKFSISQGNEFNSQFMKNDTDRHGYNSNANVYGTNQDQTDQQFESLDQQFEDFGQQFEDIGQQFESTNQQKQGHNNTQEELIKDFGQEIQTSWYPSEKKFQKPTDSRNKEQTIHNGEQSNTDSKPKFVPLFNNEKDIGAKEIGVSEKKVNNQNSAIIPIVENEQKEDIKKTSDLEMPTSSNMQNENPGFWKSVGNKFVNAKNKISSWFS